MARVPSAANSTGRRTALARWLTRPDHPLTARVMVNRLWQYHFGRGLVATSSDFGRLGERPSHPELLDWLASEFVGHGWSLKQLHRLIMTSAAYRQSALRPAPEAARLKDPDNRLLWRMNTRRLDAEQIRDAMLAVSGELDPTHGRPRRWTRREPRRTIYTKVIRNTRDPLLDAFDVARRLAQHARAQRDDHADAGPADDQRALDARTGRGVRRPAPPGGGRRRGRIALAYRLAFGRPPSRRAGRGRRVPPLPRRARRACRPRSPGRMRCCGPAERQSGDERLRPWSTSAMPC